MLKQGNTYILKATINNVDIEDISKVIFKFNNIEKEYNTQSTGDVTYDDGNFIINLSQAETLTLDNTVYYEVAVKFTDNSVKRSNVKKTSTLNTIIEREI